MLISRLIGIHFHCSFLLICYPYPFLRLGRLLPRIPSPTAALSGNRKIDKMNGKISEDKYNTGEYHMAKTSNQKAKILYLMELFQEETDEEHPLSRRELEQKLADIGIHTLKNFGMDIAYRKEQPEGYYLAEREFELPELKLLVDAVQSSRFITQKKSDALIKKIEKLTDRHEARKLQRQVVVADRIKAMNESIYYNVDKLHAAIAEDRQILFRYFEWTVSKEIRLKKGGENYQVSPWALTWDNENYYLIGYDVEAGILKHFRVDKMLHIGLLDIKREGREEFSRFDLARYTRQTFGMFGGNEQTLRLRFHNKYVGVVIDRFGKNVPLRPDGEEHFIARVSVAVSEQFFGWLTGLGRDAQILSPEAVVKEYAELLKDLLKMHEEK